MATLDDLPEAAVRLIVRAARTRRIPGTNRFASVCRGWRYAVLNSDDEEQLQLLLPLEGLPAGTVASTSQWLAQHGSCVNNLHITYNDTTASLFQQLPLSTTPLANLARLEVDGPDSLVALAPSLPQLVALTHLRAGIGLVPIGSSTQSWSPGAFSVKGAPLEAPLSLQQLCPGLKSLRLNTVCNSRNQWVVAPLEQLLPDQLKQLHIQDAPYANTVVHSADFVHRTSLRRLTLTSMCVVEPDELLLMPELEQLDLDDTTSWEGYDASLDLTCRKWATPGECPAPQHLTKLTFLDTRGLGFPFPEAMLDCLSGLRSLEVFLSGPGTAASMQQLSALSRLQHMSLRDWHATGDVAAVISGLSVATQLTALGVRIRSKEVGRSTWAGLLPCLTQLRVLVVYEHELLQQGLAAELYRLSQLQCLYVAGPWLGTGQPAHTCAAVARHLQALSQCSSLRAVLCWSTGFVRGTPPPLWEYKHEGRLHLSCWHKWELAAEEGRVVCPRPCPHLPGVWELQQQEADG
jgi:hypothetical protein